ncbi:MAG: glycosyltransferase family 2 protein [Bacteroidetes bacterium]|nr:glycosyltransferase family 2 protein [Bacteroidota bacterium]
MTKISVAIITFNEEKNIERCLRSVQEIADEIVVVDSFSKDKTEEICKAFPAKFIPHAFEGHIQQKNYAISQCSGDYVLSLDADEALSEELKSSIKKLQREGFQSHSYKFNRLSSYCGHWVKHCGWYPDTKVRLIKKGTAKWGGVNPHDELQAAEPSKTIHLKGDLLHYTIHSREEHYKQVEYFTTIGANEAFLKGKKSNWAIIFAKAAFKFFRDYIIKLGILDGLTGFHISRISAYATYRKYYKILLLQRNSGK